MDLFGISLYLEQGYAKFKKWLATERGTYTNRDLLVDQLQILVLAGLIAQVILR